MNRPAEVRMKARRNLHHFVPQKPAEGCEVGAKVV
jgi:hypothetical protein